MQLIPIEKYFLTETLFVRPEGLFSAFLIEHPRRNILIVAFHYVILLFLFHHMLIFTSLCQLVIRISGNKNMLQKNTSQCKIFIVPEEGWFGQPKYSTHSNKRGVGFYLYILHFVCEADRPFATNDHMVQNV